MIGWLWHQLDHMQIIRTLLQTDKHTSTSPVSFYRPDAVPAANQQRDVTEGINTINKCSNYSKLRVNTVYKPEVNDFAVRRKQSTHTHSMWNNGTYISNIGTIARICSKKTLQKVVIWSSLQPTNKQNLSLILQSKVANTTAQVSAVADKLCDAQCYSHSVVNKDGHSSVINLQWSKYADNTCDGPCAMVNKQKAQKPVIQSLGEDSRWKYPYFGDA